MAENPTRELTKEEADALTSDLQAVLEKHNCEMGVISSIQLLKRVEAQEPIVSPIQPNGTDETKEITDTPSEEGGSGSGEEPVAG